MLELIATNAVAAIILSLTQCSVCQPLNSAEDDGALRRKADIWEICELHLTDEHAPDNLIHPRFNNVHDDQKKIQK